MKFLSILVIFILCHFQNLWAQKDSIIISKMVVSEDEELHGVKGILVSFIYKFPDFQKDSLNLKVEDKSYFKMRTHIYTGNELVRTNSGWSVLQDKADNFLMTTEFNGSVNSIDRKSRILEQFIPYAALKLPEGENSITIESSFEGRDMQLKKYKQLLKKDKIIINIPTSLSFSISLDSFVVNKLNGKGRNWDYSVFGSSPAPDIEVRIMMGSTIVWRQSTNNTYKFIPKKNSKSINFNICSGDEIVLSVLDLDTVGYEKIANFILQSFNKIIDAPYYISEAKDNLKACHFSFAVSNN